MIKKLFQNQSGKEKTGYWLLSQKINPSQIFFYLLVLFLPTQFGKHFWPDFSYVYGIRIDYLSPTLYLTDILIIGLILSWVLESLVKGNIFSKAIKTLKDNLAKTLILFIFVLFLLIGIFHSSNPQTGVYEIIKILEYIFLISYTAKNFRILNKLILLSTFICGVFLESILTIAQYFNHGSIGGILYYLGERSFNSQTPGIANTSINGQLFLRPYATFSHPNVLAAYLFIFMSLIFIYSKEKIFKYQNKIILITLILGSIALFLTMSRASIFAWSAMAIFLIGQRFWKKTRMVSTKKVLLRQSKGKIFFMLFFISALFIFTFPVGFRFFQFNFSDQSVTQRETLMQSSIVMFEQSPIFGVGLNNFLNNLPTVQKQSSQDIYIQPVHNIYLLVLAETGIIGLVLFIFFIWISYKKLKKNTNTELLILFFLILLLGLVDHYFLTLQQGQLLFILLFGLFWSSSKKTTVKKSDNIKT